MSVTGRIKLPIDSHLDALVSALKKTRSLIIQASPGTGKTTRVPPALLSQIQGKILILQPRRIAARMAAQRIAEELGEELGKTVGYRVRFEKAVSDSTRIEFLTEGLFLRQMHENPKLDGVGCVILDEFHERHIHTDTALALVRQMQLTKRNDLVLILMSATLPSSELKTYLPEAEVLSVNAAMHPVRIDYRAKQSVSDAVINLLNEGPDGHILVFLTGARDIANEQNKLQNYEAKLGFRTYVLHGSMNLSEQRQVFSPTAQRKVILATNIAETSITIDGVSGVVDSGLAKISGFANWSGLQTLSVRPISQASSIQRAGRAGRTGPGVCVRLYDELDYSRRPAYEKAELHRSDLTPLVLELKLLSAKFGSDFSVEKLPWFDPPEKARLDLSAKLLYWLEALNENNEITPLGKEMARLPMHPRLSRLVLAGKKQNCTGGALLAAAALGESLFKYSDNRQEKVDFFSQLSNLQKELKRGSGFSQRLQQIITQSSRELGVTPNDVQKPINEADICACLFKAYPDRVEKNPSKDKLNTHNFILALEAQENPYARQDKVMIRVSVPMAEELLVEGHPDFLKETTELLWDEQLNRARKLVRLTYREHLLEDREVEAASEEIEPILQKALRRNWPKPFGDVSDLEQLRGRILFLKGQNIAAEFPDLTQELPDQLVATICQGKSGFNEILTQSFSDYLEAMLDEKARKALRDLAPSHLQLTPKRRVIIHYDQGKPPWIESRIQDFFKMAKTPTICHGRQPLVLHLLAPNGRAEQVTSDLAAFWQNIYPKLRQSLGRRYPRQPWPEDPLA